MSYNTILATAPLTTQNYHLKMIGTSIGNSLIWDNGTNVGIGNQGTTYTLDVSGTGRFTGAITGGSTLDTAGTITSTVGVANTSLLLKRTGNTFECVVQDNQSRIRTFGASGNDKDLLFDTDNAGTTRLFIKGSNGNVGIGTTGASYPLHIGSIYTDAGSMSSGGNLYGSAYFGQSGLVVGIQSTTSNTALFTNGTNKDILFGCWNGSSNSEKMRITSEGNVGIGTSSPANILHTYAALPRIISDTSTRFAVFNLYYQGAEKGAFYLDNQNKDIILEANGDNTYELRFSTQGTERMRIGNSGVVKIANLSSNGTVSTQSSNGTLYVSSDANLKIEDGFVENGLEKVLALKPRYFYWKDKEAFSADRQLGFYAQEVNAVSEETANTPPEGCGWGIYDRGLVALLTAAIQEMNTKLDEQNQTIQSLQEQINILAK